MKKFKEVSPLTISVTLYIHYHFKILIRQFLLPEFPLKFHFTPLVISLQYCHLLQQFTISFFLPEAQCNKDFSSWRQADLVCPLDSLLTTWVNNFVFSKMVNGSKSPYFTKFLSADEWNVSHETIWHFISAQWQLDSFLPTLFRPAWILTYHILQLSMCENLATPTCPLKSCASLSPMAPTVDAEFSFIAGGNENWHSQFWKTVWEL